jgi:quinol monooxygenase YgiN
VGINCKDNVSPWQARRNDLSYVVAKDASDENTIWLTEVWDGMSSHEASLSLPAVKNAIPRGKAIVSNFEKIAVTSPVWGAGLPAAHAH